MDLKAPWITYVGLIIALIAAVAGTVFFKEWADILWMVAGLAGFGSMASLAAYITLKGWKTYVLAVGGGVSALLLGLGYITVEVYQGIMGLVMALTGMSLQHRVQKLKEE